MTSKPLRPSTTLLPLLLALGVAPASRLDAQASPAGASSAESQDEKTPSAEQSPAERAAKAKAALLEIVTRGKRTPEVIKAVSAGYGFVGLCKALYAIHQGEATLAAKLKDVEGSASSDAKVKDSVRGALTAYLGGTASDADKKLLTEHGATVKWMLKGARTQIRGMRMGQLGSFMNVQLRSGARYIGQYAPARHIGPDVLDLGLELLEGANLNEAVRSTLLIAMRDFVREPKMTPKQVKILEGYVEDEFEDPSVVLAATGLLAYGGHDEIYKKRVAEWGKLAEEAEAADALEHYSQLAELHSIAEKNDEAAKVYAKLIVAAEKAELEKRVLASHSYNHACALEKSGQREAALAALDKALTLETASLARATLWLDRDIAAIRKTKEFGKLLEKHKLEWPKQFRPATRAPQKQGESKDKKPAVSGGGLRD